MDRSLIVLSVIVGICTLLIVVCGQRNAQESLTLPYVYGRVRSLERKLSRTQKEISNAQALIKDLQTRLERGGGAAGGGGSNTASTIPGRKFSDLSRCPIRAEGFFYAPQFRSCYRLESSDQLVNQTEATRICRSLFAKADLVAIETQAEQEFLKTRWHEERGVGSLVRYWTSARRDNGGWQWESKNAPLTFTNWIPTTTHSDDRFSCMAVYSNEAYTWIDVACWAPHLVTCEVNL